MVNVIKRWSRLPSEVCFVVSIHGDTHAKHGCEKPAAAALALNKGGPGCAPDVLSSLLISLSLIKRISVPCELSTLYQKTFLQRGYLKAFWLLLNV